jgi:selenocysteine lyase/cysteine desulfurase
VFGWRSDKGWRSVATLNHGVAELPDGAERYEGGMLNFPVLYAMGESIRMFLDIGPENIERRVLDLGSQVESIVRESGGNVVHPGGNIVAANWTGRDAEKLAASLKEKRIVAAARHGNLRISAHFYNNEDDLEKLRAAL